MTNAVGEVVSQQRSHADPADRTIVATAVSLGTKLVTNDEKLIRCSHIETVW